MSIFTRLFKKTQQRSVIYGTDAAAASGLTPDFGVQVSPNASLKITAYSAGIRLIAENVASLPKRILKASNVGKVADNAHPVYRAINIRPNAYTNVYDFWFTIVAWFLNRGNAFALIQNNFESGAIELHQIHPDYVQVVIINGHKYYKVSHPDPDMAFVNGTWPDYRILHFMRFTMDGIIGLNPVIYNAIALNKGMAIEKYIAAYFAKGGDKRAVLETDNNLGDDDYQRFMAHYTSTGTGGTPLLEYGIKYKQVNVDPVTAALIESEIFSIDDIARMLNIPPHMLAEMSKSTFSNIEHQTIQFVQYTLRPIVKRLEVELETKLFSQSRDEHDVKFVLDGLLRGDTAARTAFYHGAILDGFMSRNEVREMEGLTRVAALDDYLYPANEFIVGDDDPEEQPKTNEE